MKKEEIHLRNGKCNKQVETNGFLSNDNCNNNINTQNINGKINNISNGVSTSNSTFVSSAIKRKRLLSDRGERELEYPICDARTSTNGWSGCNFVVLLLYLFILLYFILEK